MIIVITPVKAETYDLSENENFINSVSESYNLDPNLVKAVIKTESSCNTEALSNAGCVGLMQISPKWHEDRCTKLGLTVDDLYDGNSNILVGCDYLSELINTYQDIPFALMVYNEGYTHALKTYQEIGISDYANKVLSNYYQIWSEYYE